MEVVYPDPMDPEGPSTGPSRGYNKNEIQGEKDRVLWDSKQEVIRKREERGKNPAKSKAGPPGIPVVVPDK